MFAFIFFVYHLFMNKKDYIFNMTSLIINRLKFHAPILQDDFIDFEKIISLGVDATLPVFVYQKPMTALMAKCFGEVKKIMPFNLVVLSEDKFTKKLHAIVTNNSEVKKLNVNYKSGLQFDYHKQSDFIKVNGVTPNRCLNEFFLESFTQLSSVDFLTREFVLCGNNYYFEFFNKSNLPQQVSFEININLGRGYYCFRKLKNAIQITNLFNHEKQYFNFIGSGNQFCFSCVDGVENSCYARVYLCCNLTLKPKQKQYFFFNFGSQKFCISSKQDMDYFMQLCKAKNYEKFDVKIFSSSQLNDRLINSVLPQKIYNAWLCRKRDYEAERRYITLKSQYVLRDKDGYVLNNISQLNQLKLWNGKLFKDVFVAKSNSPYNRILQVGENKFEGENAISFKQLSLKNSPIFVFD